MSTLTSPPAQAAPATSGRVIASILRSLVRLEATPSTAWVEAVARRVLEPSAREAAASGWRAEAAIAAEAGLRVEGPPYTTVMDDMSVSTLRSLLQSVADLLRPPVSEPRTPRGSGGLLSAHISADWARIAAPVLARRLERLGAEGAEHLGPISFTLSRLVPFEGAGTDGDEPSEVEESQHGYPRLPWERQAPVAARLPPWLRGLQREQQASFRGEGQNDGLTTLAMVQYGYKLGLEELNAEERLRYERCCRLGAGEEQEEGGVVKEQQQSTQAGADVGATTEDGPSDDATEVRLHPPTLEWGREINEDMLLDFGVGGGMEEVSCQVEAVHLVADLVERWMTTGTKSEGEEGEVDGGEEDGSVEDADGHLGLEEAQAGMKRSGRPLAQPSQILAAAVMSAVQHRLSSQTEASRHAPSATSTPLLTSLQPALRALTAWHARPTAAWADGLAAAVTAGVLLDGGPWLTVSVAQLLAAAAASDPEPYGSGVRVKLPLDLDVNSDEFSLGIEAAARGPQSSVSGSGSTHWTCPDETLAALETVSLAILQDSTGRPKRSRSNLPPVVLSALLRSLAALDARPGAEWLRRAESEAAAAIVAPARARGRGRAAWVCPLPETVCLVACLAHMGLPEGGGGSLWRALESRMVNGRGDEAAAASAADGSQGSGAAPDEDQDEAEPGEEEGRMEEDGSEGGGDGDGDGGWASLMPSVTGEEGQAGAAEVASMLVLAAEAGLVAPSEALFECLVAEVRRVRVSVCFSEALRERTVSAWRLRHRAAEGEADDGDADRLDLVTLLTP